MLFERMKNVQEISEIGSVSLQNFSQNSQLGFILLYHFFFLKSHKQKIHYQLFN